jgi:hypothetical protein
MATITMAINATATNNSTTKVPQQGPPQQPATNHQQNLLGTTLFHTTDQQQQHKQKQVTFTTHHDELAARIAAASERFQTRLESKMTTGDQDNPQKSSNRKSKTKITPLPGPALRTLRTSEGQTSTKTTT